MARGSTSNSAAKQRSTLPAAAEGDGSRANFPLIPEADENVEPGPPSPASKREAVRRRSAHFAGLVLAAMVGCLIRLGLDAMAAYDGQIIFALAWAQGVGCGIMGLASSRKDEITGFYPPLYTFITTGLAGSVTSFSAWMLDGYQSFSNFGGYQRSGFHSSVDGFAYSFATMAIAIGCLYWGEHVSRCLPSISDIHRHLRRPARPAASEKLPTATPRGSSSTTSSAGSHSHYSLRPRTQLILDYLLLLSAVLCYLIALLVYFLGPSSWRLKATFPILLSPPGAMLRFYLADFNSKGPFTGRFPLGTFVANIGGTLLMGGVYAAEFLPSSQRSGVQCNALWAIQQGFCGCLTTVSTFVLESQSIKMKRWTWVYVGSSVVLGHLCILATFGAARMAGRLGESICSA